MKKYEFTLEKVRDFKSQILNREKNLLLGLRMERNRLEADEQGLKDLFEQLNDEMHEEFCQGMCVSRIRLFEYRKNGIREERRSLGDKMTVLDASIERQQRRVAAVKQEVSGLDKLEEKQREDYIRQMLKEQEEIIAEFVSAQLISGKASGE
ncbi:MAG: hypothetical protein QM689_07830 [Oscillospiraceae bacterium]